MGIVSSRKIERACCEDLAFRVLTGHQQPDHSRISEFRRCNLDALKGQFIQILRLCQKAGMVQAKCLQAQGDSHERMLRVEKELEKEIKSEHLRARETHAQGLNSLYESTVVALGNVELPRGTASRGAHDSQLLVQLSEVLQFCKFLWFNWITRLKSKHYAKISPTYTSVFICSAVYHRMAFASSMHYVQPAKRSDFGNSRCWWTD
ncbi:transposase [Synechococcus sp. CBW1002]|uniref:transposase n=1 Tax=Synechococcus sp. CBW1002 TaxID=1353134 RepID=UPI0018CD46A9|nr:transposase [Synechococcus sp. CBW1002]QPN61379.1 transposase [Synechococcus sp. CBW1002]QPN68050.1 transposase [Synechococcus sp. CBW1006]